MTTRRAASVLLIAAIAAIALSACGGSSSGSVVTTSGKVNGHTVEGLYGSLPVAGTPTAGGTISMGQLNGDTPTYLFPIIPGANGTDGTAFLISQLYVPLYNLQVGGSMQVNYATSLALPPKFSDGDKRVTIQLRSGATWSNGKPVTANDVLFNIALLKAAVKESPANWEQYTPGLMPDNIADATAANSRTVVLTFTRAYNPAYLLGNELAYTLYPMPSSEWDIDATGGAHRQLARSRQRQEDLRLPEQAGVVSCPASQRIRCGRSSTGHSSSAASARSTARSRSRRTRATR